MTRAARAHRPPARRPPDLPRARHRAAEIVFLTHNEDLHQVDVRYRTGWKGRWLRQLTDLVEDTLPGCRVRHAF